MIENTEKLKTLSPSEIDALCGEIRAEILDAVSANGGHLASNLGVVELSVALHRVFDSPRDKIVFDVGHQCYAHKILTGRGERMHTLRRFGGLSGFPSREESEHDPFTTGHSGTSLSAALGMAEANRLQGSDAWTVAVIGDASFGNGMIYEALAGCARKGLRLMIVLNDNEMSISKNVGGLSDYFAKIRLSGGYFAFKRTVKTLFAPIPLIGKPMIAGAIRVKEFIKRSLNQKNIFESFGLEYLGPADGSDESLLETLFREAMDCDVPCIVHVITKKGLGYLPAEEHPEKYHGVSPFSLLAGVPDKAGSDTFSSVFGEVMCTMAAEDKSICAVTAAMPTGTGLSTFGEKYPDRFFDAGIAEEHAVTFAAGLARAGMKPVCALYSTFAQRTFDQVLHDAALQKLSLTLALDRCGIVPGDGVTHQGIFDISLFSPIPGVRIYAPESFGEMGAMLRACMQEEGVKILRYPRGCEADYDRSVWVSRGSVYTADFGGNHPDTVIITYGRESLQALLAADSLAGGGRCVRVIRLGRLLPLPTEEITAVLGGAKRCLIAEEAIRRGGIGEMLAASGILPQTEILAIGDFLPHGDEENLLRLAGLDAGSIAAKLR